MRKQHIFEGRPSFSNCYYEISNSTVANFVGCVYKRLLLTCKRALEVSCDTTAIITARLLIYLHGEALKKLLEILTDFIFRDWLIMQAFTSPYVCPYFTCSSPYCLALRSSAVAPSLSVNRPPTSPTSQPGGITSFTISSILSRSEEQTTKTGRSEETTASKSSSEGSLSQFSPYTSHVSVERFHPYHRPLTASAFVRTTCNALQKGEP